MHLIKCIAPDRSATLEQRLLLLQSLALHRLLMNEGPFIFIHLLCRRGMSTNIYFFSRSNVLRRVIHHVIWFAVSNTPKGLRHPSLVPELICVCPLSHLTLCDLNKGVICGHTFAFFQPLSFSVPRPTAFLALASILYEVGRRVVYCVYRIV
jgi:hypothetical protein